MRARQLPATLRCGVGVSAAPAAQAPEGGVADPGVGMIRANELLGSGD